jgi:hypothetical protein
MVCKIERLASRDGSVVLSVSGGLRGQDLDTLREVLREEESVVTIDLKDVLLVDRDTITLLAVCERDGIELRNCPAYIREWMGRERARTGPPFSD